MSGNCYEWKIGNEGGLKGGSAGVGREGKGGLGLECYWQTDFFLDP